MTEITPFSKVKIMKTIRSTLINSIAATFAALMLTACGGGSGDGGGGGGSTGTASLSLTDAPIDEAYDVSVYFDGVEFQPKDGDRVIFYLADDGFGECEVVESLDGTADPCKVNLLDYQGKNKVTLLDGITLPSGQYSWVRLILNKNPGYIVLTEVGDQYDLRVPGGAETGLKLHGGFIVAAGNHTDYTIDFDVRKSIHDPVGSSDYILRPTLRMVDNSEVGSLSGTIDHSVYVADSECTGAVYVFSDVVSPPDDLDGTDDPITTALISTDGAYAYTVGFLTAGEYLAAFTCDALADTTDVDDDSETVSFLSQAKVIITAGENTIQDFPPAAP